MDPEMWAFLTANSLALLALVGKAVDGYVKGKANASKVDEILENTLPISNGTIPRMASDLSMIKELVLSLDGRVGRLEERESRDA